MPLIDRLLVALLSPRRLFIALWKRLGWGSFPLRVKYDATRRPHYAYGILHAAEHARRLGLARVAVVEMGVAGGNGLLLMEEYAAEAEAATGVKVEVYGFDLENGLPDVVDYRDMPYFFRGGAFPMDRTALEARLQRAKLVIGDVKETIGRFAETHAPAPIGFVAFDLDLYSSTRDAFALFDLPHDLLLPRIVLYFDDIIGGDMFVMSDKVGELLAIEEFNTRGAMRRICPIFGFAEKRLFPAPWSVKMYGFHRYDHPLYNRFIAEEENRLSLALRAVPR